MAEPLATMGRELAGLLVPYLARRTRALGDALRTHGLLAAEEAGDESSRLGFGLGLVAAACGIDVLHQRVEQDGLRRFLELLARAAGVADDAAWRHLPALAVGGGWEAPLLVGWTWLAASRAGRGREWSQSADARQWWFTIPDVLPDGRLRHPHGASWCWRHEGARLGLGLPRAWIRPRVE